MTTKKATEPIEEVAAEPAPEPIPKRNPLVTIAVDFNRTGEYAYQSAPAGFAMDFSLLISGVRVEHVGQDVEGVWYYRRQPTQ